MLFASLRSILMQSRGTGLAVSPPLLEQASAFLEQLPHDDDIAVGYRAELAFILSEVMTLTADFNLLKRSFFLLTDLGVLGERLCLFFLMKNAISIKHAMTLLEELEPEKKLLMVNGVFSLVRDVDPLLLSWAESTLESMIHEDPEELLVFMERLTERREPAVSSVIQNELASGRMGVWLQQLLALDLDEEQTLFMAKTASRLRSATLAGLLSVRAQRCQSTATQAQIMRLITEDDETLCPRVITGARQFVNRAEPETMLVGLEVLIRNKSEEAATYFVQAYTEMPQIRRQLCAMTAHFSANLFGQVVPLLPKTLLPSFLFFCLYLASLVDGEFFETHCNTYQENAKSEEEKEAISRVQEGYSAYYQSLSSQRRLFRERNRQIHDERVDMAVGELGKDIGSFVLLLKEAAAKLTAKEPKKQKRSCLLGEPGTTITKVRETHTVCSGQTIQGLKLETTTIKHTDLGASRVQSVTFRNCLLDNIDFTKASLTNVRFVNCTLIYCRFRQVRMEKVVFDECTLKGVTFGEAESTGLAMRHCILEECDFYGAWCHEPIFLGCQCSVSAFGLSAWSHGVFDALTFTDCLFEKTLLETMRVQNCRVLACIFLGVRFFNLDTNSAVFERQVVSTVTRLFAAAANTSSPKPHDVLRQKSGMRFVLKLLSQWFFERDMRRRKTRYLEMNARRLEWAAQKMGDRKAAFLSMLPGLLSFGGVQEGRDILSGPACRITGWRPSLETRKQLIEFYGAQAVKTGEAATRESTMELAAIYTIGSIGTIAQTEASDLDIWICFESDQVEADALGSFRRKVLTLEAIAAETFSLEVHFFLMDLQKVRENDFGFSDEESCGSTQSLLLKEEFYRTGVHVAGRYPAWWLVPPGADERLQQRTWDRIQASPTLRSQTLVDLGGLRPIPKAEFFGAALWQIVKSLKSPFKSALKFGLLEKYYMGEDTTVFLCDKIKENIFSGSRDVWDIDAYAMLFREVDRFYSKTAQAEAKRLMQLAFIQKNGWTGRRDGQQGKPGANGSAFIEYFFPASEVPIASELMAETGRVADAQKGIRFTTLLATGNQIASYLFSTYERLLQYRDSKARELHINDQDLTRVGRTIISAFEKKPNKVMRVPFVNPPRAFLEGLKFNGVHVGNTASWSVDGECAGSGKKEASEEFRRDGNLVRLALWLVVNDIYSPRLYVHGKNILAPVSLPDIQELLETLRRFFPIDEVLHPALGESSRSERVTRVLVIYNFFAPREDKTICDAVIVFSTNWGEIFCRVDPQNIDDLEKAPLAFLDKNLDRPLGPDAMLDAVCPAKSMCPRVNIALFA